MTFNPGTELKLYMTHVESEGPYLKVFGQPDKQQAVAIESLIVGSKDKFEKGYGTVQPSQLQNGTICVAKYRDGNYYRARITNTTNISNGVVCVHFIDYGNNDMVPVSSVRVLNLFPEAFRNSPPQASDFLLACVFHPMGVWDEYIINELRNYIFYHELTCVVELYALNKYFIRMQHNGHDIAEMLISKGYGEKISLKEQAQYLQTALNGSKVVQETRSTYVPPAARLANLQLHVALNQSRTNERMATYSSQVSPPLQVPPVGRGIVRDSMLMGRNKIKNVIPPRPLNRNIEDKNNYQPLESPNPISASRNPSTYRGRFLELYSNHEVLVSYAKEGPKLFAIQLKSDERFLSNIVAQINSVPPVPLTEPPMIGSACLGRFSEDNTLCRAVVMGSTPSQCKLFFVDFGMTESVSFSDIFRISEKDVSPDVFALRFSLSGITKLNVTEEMKNEFYQIVNNKILTLKVVPPDGPPLIQYCELYAGEQSVKNMLLQTVNPSFQKIDASTITGNHSVLVSYVDSCTKFFIQLSENIDALNAVMEQVEIHCNETQPLLYHQVKTGMSCCALFPDDHNWYRAIVTNIRKDKITVNYVDYGNEQDLTVNSLRPIKPELVKMKSQAIHCALKEFEDKPFDQNTSNNLEKLTLEKILLMHVHGMLEGGVLLVDLIDQSAMPHKQIAQAIKEAVAAISSAPTQQKYTQEIASHNTTDEIKTELPTEPVSEVLWNEAEDDNSFSSKDTDSSQKSRRPYQNKGDKNFSQGNRDNDKRKDYGQKSFRIRHDQLKGNVTGQQDGSHFTSSKPKSQQQNRRFAQDKKSQGGFVSQYHRDRDSKPDKLNRPQYPRRDYEGGRKPFSDSNRGKKYDNSWKNDKLSDSSNRSRDYETKNYETRSYDTAKSLTNPVPLEIPFEKYVIGNGDVQKVNISWFINPNDFYIFILDKADQLKNMMLGIPKLYNGIKPLNVDIPIGSSVIARFPEDQVLYRATIIETNFSGKYTIQFIDFGNKCVVDSQDLWQLENELMTLPKQALNCSLTDVAPLQGNWAETFEIDACFNSTYNCTFNSQDYDGKFYVTLINEDGIDVKQMLIEKQLAISSDSTYSGQSDKVKATECAKVFVTHIDTPGQFWLQLESNTEKIDALQRALQSADSFEECLDREVGKLCVAKYSADEQYYRTVILDSDKDIITVRFIDYGNTDVLDNSPGVLKCLPSEMQDVEEPYAMKCSVNATPTGTGQWTEQASEQFTKLLGNIENPVDAAFILKDATTYVNLYVDGQNITDKLVEAGHATLSEKPNNGDLPTCFASHVNSPSEFWIQLESSIHDLEAISEELVIANEFAPLSEIAEEVICAAKFPEDDLWYRAQVIIHGSDGTEVLFMDYGNASLTNELRSLPDNLKNLPALSRKCALQKPTRIKNWSKEAELKFAELAADGATIFQVAFIASGDISIVELCIDGRSVTDELVSLCDTSSSSPTRLPLIGEDKISPIFISHSNSPEDFWVHHCSSAENLNIITTALSEASKLKPLEKFKEGTICASLFPEDCLYYRSKILDHGENGCEVLHIDLGSTAVTSDLKEMPQDLCEIPPLAKHCTLLMPHDRSKINEKLHEKFAELAIDDSLEYHMEMIDSNVDPMVIRLMINGQDVNDYLGCPFKPDASSLEDIQNIQAETLASPEKSFVLESPVLESINPQSVNSEDIQNIQAETLALPEKSPVLESPVLESINPQSVNSEDIQNIQAETLALPEKSPVLVSPILESINSQSVNSEDIQNVQVETLQSENLELVEKLIMNESLDLESSNSEEIKMEVVIESELSLSKTESSKVSVEETKINENDKKMEEKEFENTHNLEIDVDNNTNDVQTGNDNTAKVINDAKSYDSHLKDEEIVESMKNNSLESEKHNANNLSGENTMDVDTKSKNLNDTQQEDEILNENESSSLTKLVSKSKDTEEHQDSTDDENLDAEEYLDVSSEQDSNCGNDLQAEDVENNIMEYLETYKSSSSTESNANLIIESVSVATKTENLQETANQEDVKDLADENHAKFLKLSKDASNSNNNSDDS